MIKLFISNASQVLHIYPDSIVLDEKDLANLDDFANRLLRSFNHGGYCLELPSETQFVRLLCLRMDDKTASWIRTTRYNTPEDFDHQELDILMEDQVPHPE